MAVRLHRLMLTGLPSVQAAQVHRRCLYIIQEEATTYFKVGIAGHPLRRLSALQGGNRRKLFIRAAYHGSSNDCAYCERAVLRYFKAQPKSEWFSAEYIDDVTQFLDSFCEEEPTK